MNSSFRASSIILSLAIAGPLGAGGGLPGGIDPPVTDRAVVRLAGTDVNDFITLFNAKHPDTPIQSVLDSIPSREIYLLDIIFPADLDILEAYLESAPGLVWADLVYQNEAPEGKTGSTWVTHVVFGTDYEAQYTGPLLNLPAAHKRSHGQGVVVAVLDTGIDASHPVFNGRVRSDGFNFVENNTNTDDVGDGKDTDADGVTDEMVGHGTYVAALISFVAPQAQILPVVVLNGDGVGDIYTLIKGMYFAMDRGVELINLSLGSTYDSDGVEEALEAAEDLGIVIASSAGNFDRDDPREFPAMKSPQLGVTATDDLDVKADFSNYHQKIFISAPGASAIDPDGTADPDRSIISALPGGEFAIWQGTSMAAPLVSGAAALIRAQYPQLSGLALFEQIETNLETTAFDIYPLNPDFDPDEGQLGAGRLDIGAAVALGPPAPPVGDLDYDGAVGILDLLLMLSSWGPCPDPPAPCPADLNGDGSVGILDLLMLLANWG